MPTTTVSNLLPVPGVPDVVGDAVGNPVGDKVDPDHELSSALDVHF